MYADVKSIDENFNTEAIRTRPKRPRTEVKEKKLALRLRPTCRSKRETLGPYTTVGYRLLKLVDERLYSIR